MDDKEYLNSKRRRLANWPDWLQWFLTWLSGLALPGEKRRRPWTPLDHLLVYFATLILAGTSAVFIVQQMVETGFVYPPTLI